MSGRVILGYVHGDVVTDADPFAESQPGDGDGFLVRATAEEWGTVNRPTPATVFVYPPGDPDPFRELVAAANELCWRPESVTAARLTAALDAAGFPVHRPEES
jgi:hypothetical protein